MEEKKLKKLQKQHSEEFFRLASQSSVFDEMNHRMSGMISNRMSARTSLDVDLLNDDGFTRPSNTGDTITGINQTSPRNNTENFENNIVISSGPD